MIEGDVQFKKKLFGGYDKEDVHTQYESVVAAANEESKSLTEELQIMKQELTNLSICLKKSEEEKNQLKKDLTAERERTANFLIEQGNQKTQLQRAQAEVQKYKDDYLCISKQMVDAQKRADAIVEEAEKTKLELLAAAEKESLEKRVKTEHDIKVRLEEGEKQYKELQNRMKNVLAIFNSTQAEFMSTYKEVHRIMDDLPDSISD